MRAILLLAPLLAFTTLDPAPAAIRGAAASDGGDARGETLAYHFSYPTSGVADLIAATGTFSLTLPDGSALRLELEEFDLFEPGERRVEVLGPEGEVQSVVPITDRMFSGRVVDETGAALPGPNDAYLQVSDHGLFGVAHAGGKKWSLQDVQPGDAHAGKTVVALAPVDGMPYQEVTVVPQSPDGQPAAHRASASEPSSPASAQAQSCSRYKVLRIKMWADNEYPQYTRSYASRMSSAYGSAQSMWRGETCITLSSYAITVSQYNYAQRWGTCGNGGDIGLDVWKNAMTPIKGPNAYVFFSAKNDPGRGVGGCAVSSHLDLTATPPAQHDVDAAAAITAKDWYGTDGIDPDETDHLAIAANHELTHLAGEPDHLSDRRSSCDYNLMNVGTWFGCVNLWRTDATRGDVTAYAYNQRL